MTGDIILAEIVYINANNLKVKNTTVFSEKPVKNPCFNQM
jgi:hypothetical protein